VVNVVTELEAIGVPPGVTMLSASKNPVAGSKM
jgi:hypothetical protein